MRSIGTLRLSGAQRLLLLKLIPIILKIYIGPQSEGVFDDLILGLLMNRCSWSSLSISGSHR